jgi:tetratricopeptide (TPR) repeat protein
MKNNDGRDMPSSPGAADPGDAGNVKPAEYIRMAKAHLRDGKNKDAFGVLQHAVLHYPEDPYILSYYGCLQALVDKRHRSGVETCKKALQLLKHKSLSGEEVFYPFFYLNLGRAYVAAGKKTEAIDAFHQGLKYDHRNSDILKEIRTLGIRKKPPVPFLDRSNPINKYIGKLLHGTSRGTKK